MTIATATPGELPYLTGFDDSTKAFDYPTWSAEGSRVFFSLSRKVGDLYLLEDRFQGANP